MRVVTDADGQVARACDTGVEVGRHEFLPFGEPPSLTPSGEGGSARASASQRRGITARTSGVSPLDPVYTWEENLVDPPWWNRYS